MSAETLIAFERASRALGRTDGAYRAARAPLPGIYLTLTMEALATVAIDSGEASWSKFRGAMASAPNVSRSDVAHVRAAAVLHLMIGLAGSTGRGGDVEREHTFEAALRWWPSALARTGPMPEAFASEVARDLHTWVTDREQPALVKAAIAMMVIAATKPECADTGILARQVFAVVLEAADPPLKWIAPPVSSWLAHDPSAWEVIATALAGEGDPDPDKVDRGIREVLIAVRRSATANAFHVEWAGRDAARVIEHSGAKLTHRQRMLVEILAGLPALSPDYVPMLLDVTDRGARRIIRVVIDAGLVVERRTRRGQPYLMAPGGTRAWLSSVPSYQEFRSPDTDA